MHCAGVPGGSYHAASAHRWGCRRAPRRPAMCVLGDQHHARVPGRAVQEQLEKKLRSLRERAARLQPAAEANTALDQIEQKMELLTWPSPPSSGMVQEQQLQEQQQRRERDWERPERRQAVRRQPASLRQQQGKRWGVTGAAPPWLGVAIYAVGALALALSFTAAASRKGDAVLLHPGMARQQQQQVVVVRHPEPRLEQLLGHFRMAEAPERELVPVLADGRVRLRGAAATAFFRMQEAASRDGVRLTPLSGFRSLKEQQLLFYDVKAARVQGASERARVSAPPGFSEHHTGYALDMGDANSPGTNVEAEFEQTEAYAWLQRNAARFHFEMSFPMDNPRGIAFEPWHWRFVGDDHSLWTFYGQGQQEQRG